MKSFTRWSVFLVVAIRWPLVFAGELELQTKPMKLQFEPAFILEAVAHRLDVDLRPQIAFPAIRLESVTSLEQFQDATEQQWGFRPERFVNAFVAGTNEIYLIDDPAYYAESGRTLAESLAHELAHYVQARYGRASLYDWAECEAVTVQKWFREMYLSPAAHAVATHQR